MSYYVGVDLGQRKDYTAIAVVERTEPELIRFDYVAWLHRRTKLEATFTVRRLERVAVGTSYPAIVSRVRELVRSLEFRGRCTLVVDGTGVGRPVVDLLREPDIDCELAPILITGGAHVRKEAGMWNVPKRDLIAEVQMLLEQRRLTISGQLPRAKTLIDELMAMRMRLSAEGREQYGVWREGSHDDLALAVAMACWRAKGEEVPVGEQGTGRVLSM